MMLTPLCFSPKRMVGNTQLPKLLLNSSLSREHSIMFKISCQRRLVTRSHKIRSETVTKADTVISMFCTSTSYSSSQLISHTPHRVLCNEVILCHVVPFYSMQPLDRFLHLTFFQCIYHPPSYIGHHANLTLTRLFRLLPDNGAR